MSSAEHEPIGDDYEGAGGAGREAAGGETVVPASPEEAWEAVTDPDQLGEWLGDVTELELEPGGGLSVRVDDEPREGFVEEVSEPRRLVFWWSADGAEASRVEIELEPFGDETIVRVIESRPLTVLDGDGDLAERIGGGAAPELCAGQSAAHICAGLGAAVRSHRARVAGRVHRAGALIAT